MRKKIGQRFALFILGLLTVFAVPATAPAIEVSATAGLDMMTDYVWRGQRLSDDHGVVQPYLEASYEGATVNFWANEDLGRSQHTETDLTLSYSLSLQRLSVDLGYIYYALDGFDDTQELFLSVAYDIIGSPSITYYGDFDEGRGSFVVVSIGHSLDLPNDMRLNGGFSAGVNFQNAIMGLDRRGERFTNFYNGEVSASLAIPITKNLAVEPKVAYSFALNSDARTALASANVDGDSETLYGGIGISFSF